VIGNIFSFIQIFAIACVFFGDSVWNFVPFIRGPPEWYYRLKENGTATMLGLFFIGPAIVSVFAGVSYSWCERVVMLTILFFRTFFFILQVQSFITTGAFEIELDGELIYSKLETGKMPTGVDIIGALTKAGLKQVARQ